MPGLRRRITPDRRRHCPALVIGTVGFVVIEGYPWFDAFYMSLTTITTVGYRRSIPFTPRGASSTRS